MNVWLVWTGEYSDMEVVGVYSTPELAKAAAAMHDGGWTEEEPRELDANATRVQAGLARWRVDLILHDGRVSWSTLAGPGTEEGTTIRPFEQARYVGNQMQQQSALSIQCNARDKDHAIKIAGDERRKYLAAQALSVRLINDETGWTVVTDERYHATDTCIAVPFLDVGGFGQVLYYASGERDDDGRPIFRTRQQ